MHVDWEDAGAPAGRLAALLLPGSTAPLRSNTLRTAPAGSHRDAPGAGDDPAEMLPAWPAGATGWPAARAGTVVPARPGVAQCTSST